MDATETLEITRREPGMRCTTTPTTTDAATTLRTDEPEEKKPDPTAEQTRQGQIYHIQTKTLDRPVNYTSQICLIVMPFGLQFVGTGGHDVALGLQFVAHHAVVIALRLVPVLPRRLLRKIYVGQDAAMSATESRWLRWTSLLFGIVAWRNSSSGGCPC